MAEVNPDDLRPSEFGGRRGLIQREQQLSAAEKAMLERHTGQSSDALLDQTARGTGKAFREGTTEV